MAHRWIAEQPWPAFSSIATRLRAALETGAAPPSGRIQS
jgi:hypothetical protein